VFGRKRGGGESIWELKRRIGWVSPDLQLYWNDASGCQAVVLSGFHDSLGLFKRATTRQRAETQRCLARLRLVQYADTPFAALSTGEQRMILLARALVKNPRLLILDEPCQGLDAGHRGTLIQAVERLIEDNAVTVIFVTHRDDEIPRAITRVLRLSAGRATVSSRAG
jgi:molybdate transport system ATP-binding protein